MVAEYRPTPRVTRSLRVNTSPKPNRPPLIGVTADLVDDQVRLRRTYLRELTACGAIGIPIAPIPGTAEAVLDRLDGIVLSGGDDPDTSAFGVPVHQEARLVEPDRQAFELEILELLEDRHSDLPTLGVCLGMQLMGLHAGGHLNQHLPETLPTAEEHRHGAVHAVRGREFDGLVYSHHRQALEDAGSLEIVATAPDGVIEAISCPTRRHVIGVQWHPERTEDEGVGRQVFAALVQEAERGRG
ncbi:MAG: gamma-glutamyl-gamma-aminobutyrate hydrolase [Phycisphaerae bacterium]|nr:gamma-glutamyl-gamma-aminobutyrate hydrolase [Phycisphaerae bacterium]